MTFLSVIYFQFIFPLLVCYYFRLLVVNFRFVTCVKRGTSQHTVNVNEFYTRASPGSQRVSYGADNKVAKVIGNKQTTDTQLCRGVYIHRLRLRQDRYPRFSSMGGRTRNRTF